jgi:SAM-dependent methyltransferase
MRKDYYLEYYHNEREHWWFRGRERILRGQAQRIVRRQLRGSNAKILNIGVATGRSSEWLADYGTVTSLEYDADCCEFTREHCGLDVVQGSVLDLDFSDGSFDLVCGFDVIEHVEDDVRAAAEIRRVLRPGGIAFITVPACHWLWSEHDEINHHFRRYSLRQLRNLFSDYTVLSCCGFNSILFPAIAAHRVSRSILEKVFGRSREAQSDFSRSRFTVAQRALEATFSFERTWLDRGIGPPWGVSALLVAQRS